MPKAGGEVSLRYRAGAVQLRLLGFVRVDGLVSMRGIARVRCNALYNEAVALMRFQCAVSRECGETAPKKWPSAGHLGASTGQLES